MRILQGAISLTVAGVLIFGSVNAAPGQRSGSGSGTQSGQSTTSGTQATVPAMGTGLPPSGVVDDSMKDRTTHMEEEQAKMRNNERQQKIVDDTEHLLELAAQLKIDVDRTNKDMLSIDVIRKADEIEKLAHSVKERMKG